MANQLFAKKSLEQLHQEMQGEGRLKRVLGPFELTALGVGAVIGAGIFVATGQAANEVAGPALMASYVLAGMTCIFAALCYAEFASMAPVAGSAYTYAYTTMGELFAWIIGWDLVLEYAVGAATVANGWSSYFQSLLGGPLAKWGLAIPFALSAAPIKYEDGYFLRNEVATYQGARVTTNSLKDQKGYEEGDYWVLTRNHKTLGQKGDRVGKVGNAEVEAQIQELGAHVEQKWMKAVNQSEAGIYWVLAESVEGVGEKGDRIGLAHDSSTTEKLENRQRALFNLPAILIVVTIVFVLVRGISESAKFNAAMVFVKTAAVVFVILVGSFYINPENWIPFAPYGWTGVSFFGIPVHGERNSGGDPVGMIAGAAIIFFSYIGFDAVSTHAEEAKNPKRDVPIGIIVSLLVCTVLYIGVVAVITGMVPYYDISKDAGVSDAFASVNLPWAKYIVSAAGVAGITSVLLVLLLAAPRVFMAMARDGLVPKNFFADVHPTFKTPWKSTIAVGLFVSLLAGFGPLAWLLHLANIGTLFAFAVVCASVLVMRKTNPDAERPFRVPFSPAIPLLGIFACVLLMLSLPADNWYRLIGWLALGLLIYVFYGRHHSMLGKQLRGEARME